VRTRCTDVAESDRREFRRSVARPAHWPEQGAQKGELLGQIDRLEAAVEAKNSAGERLGRQIDRCRAEPDVSEGT
jgi:hypothetical protein